MPIIIPSSSVPGETLQWFRDRLREKNREYATNVQLDRYINAGIRWLCEQERWPFLEAEEAGAAPLYVDGLLAVGLVMNGEGRVVPYESRRNLRQAGRDLTATGSGTCWYFTVQGHIATWPLDPRMTIECWLRPNLLDDPTERCPVPGSYNHVILDAADREAAKDAREWPAVEALRSDLEGHVAVMRDSLLAQQHDSDESVMVTGEWA